MSVHELISFYSKPTKNVIYVIPLGDFPEGLSPDLSIVQHFTASYFHPVTVVFLTPVKEIERTDLHMTVEIEDVKNRLVKRRYKLAIELRNGKVMFLTGDIKDMLLKEKYYLTNRKYANDIHVTCHVRTVTCTMARVKRRVRKSFH